MIIHLPCPDMQSLQNQSVKSLKIKRFFYLQPITMQLATVNGLFLTVQEQVIQFID